MFRQSSFFSFFALSILFTVNVVAAECEFNSSSELFDAIKINHPQIKYNNVATDSVGKKVSIAQQRPNPELDADGGVTDSIDGDVYGVSVSLKHTIEWGGKYGARVNAAKAEVDRDKAILKGSSEDVLIDVVLSLHKLRQLYEMIPIYEESLKSFKKIYRTKKRRGLLAPEEQVEMETLGLAVNDYELKLSKLIAEKTRLQTHLNYFTASKCEITQKSLPVKVDLSGDFTTEIKLDKYSTLKAAEKSLKFAEASYNSEKANSYPDVQIGPSFGYEKVNVTDSTTWGVSLTMDLPLLNRNKAGRSKAKIDMLNAQQNYNNAQRESELDLNSWIEKYKSLKKSLKGTISRKQLDKKHSKIESLFRRGVISTSLIIESHRQLIEFSNTRFEFEIGVIESLWNIYKIKGDVYEQEI